MKKNNKLKKVISVVLILCFAAVMLSSCDKNSADSENESVSTDSGELKIVTTIFPIYDWVKNITGGGNVVYLDGNGIDLHSFEPTANDIVKLSDADMFIYIGGESDKWVDAAVKSADNSKLVTLSLIELTGSLEEETVEGMEADEEDAAADEHVWLSLKKAEKAVRGIADALCKADAKNADTYNANAEAYINKLLELDKKYEETVSSSKNKTLLFADRFPFRYLTEDYGIGYYAAFPGCSAESEASFETMSFLINKTKELKLPCIIKIDGSDGKIADTVSEATDAKILTMNSCQSVTDKDIDGGITYISVMEENLNIIKEALS